MGLNDKTTCFISRLLKWHRSMPRDGATKCGAERKVMELLEWCWEDVLYPGFSYNKPIDINNEFRIGPQKVNIYSRKERQMATSNPENILFLINIYIYHDMEYEQSATGFPAKTLSSTFFWASLICFKESSPSKTRCLEESKGFRFAAVAADFLQTFECFFCGHTKCQCEHGHSSERK